MLVTTKVKMDLQKTDQTFRMEAVQNDCNTRSLEVAFSSGGEPWQIPEDAVAAMRYRKLDGTQGYYDTLPDGSKAWSISGNVVSMILAPQMLTLPGTVVAQLELMQGSGVLATGLVLISVTENPGAGTVTSEDYINWAQWLEDQLDEHLQKALNSGELVGPAGEAAVLVSSSVTYQAGISGTQIPEGVWSETVPEVESGDYLWTRTIYTFNTGDPVTQYSVCQSGINSGVRKFSVVLAAAGWSDTAPYAQTITVDGLTDEKNVRVYPEAPSGTLEEKQARSDALGKICWCTREGTAVTFECLNEKPGMDIPVIMEVYV